MKRKKLLKKLNKLLGIGEDANAEQIKKLRDVLKTLKEKQESLKIKRERTEDQQEQQKLQQKIDVIQRQREKGVELYTNIKEARDS